MASHKQRCYDISRTATRCCGLKWMKALRPRVYFNISKQDGTSMKAYGTNGLVHHGTIMEASGVNGLVACNDGRHRLE